MPILVSVAVRYACVSVR